MDLGHTGKNYKVLVDRRLEKDLENMPKHITKRLLRLLDEFERNPTKSRAGFDVKLLKSFPANTYCLRIGAYRVLYSVDEERREVRITTVAHRSDAYR